MSVMADERPAAYDMLWRFAAERQQVYLRKLLNPGAPSEALTDDPVIQRYRFTSPYRASDRVSQYLLTDVQSGDWDWPDTFARTMAFKMLNRVESWRRVVDALGREPDASAVADGDLADAMTEASRHGPLYSAAYVMPPPMSYSGAKHERHMLMLSRMLDDGLHWSLGSAGSMAEAHAMMESYESVGSFLAYQWVTDLNYSQYMAFPEDSFVAMGPGSRRGVRKCYPGASAAPEDLVRRTMDAQEEEFARLGLSWGGLWGRRLQMIDAQNLFCEIDKYTRVALPSSAIEGASAAPKQLYRPSPEPMTAMFPHDWGINGLASEYMRSARRRDLSCLYQPEL